MKLAPSRIRTNSDEFEACQHVWPPHRPAQPSLAFHWAALVGPTLGLLGTPTFMGGEVSSGPVGVRQCNCTYGGGEYNVDCDGQRLAHIDRAFGIRFTGRTPTARDAPRRAAVCRGVLQSGPCRHSELRPYLSGPSYPKYPLVHFRENSELLRGKGQSIAGAGRPPCEPYPILVGITLRGVCRLCLERRGF